MRRRDLAEQTLELRALRGKNSGVVRHMQNRVLLEQAEFVSGSARIHAVRSVHHTLLAQAFDLLSVSALKSELAELLDRLKQPGIKLRLKKIYGQTFFQLHERLDEGQKLATEIKIMLDSAFQQINAEFGFSLQAGQVPDVARYVHDLDSVEHSHLRYLGLGSVIRLAQADFSDRLVRALSSRLRVVFELALGEMEQWSKTASAQLDAQVRERRQNLARRLEAIERIQQAASTLDERIAELSSQEMVQKAIEAELADLTTGLSNFQPAVVMANPPCGEPVIFASEAAPA